MHLLLISTCSLAETFTGRIVHVADGDTVTLLVQNQQIKIRLAGIDAPEKGQDFGNRSKQNLGLIARGKEALADCAKTDRYGRKVCKVLVRHEECLSCVKTLDIGYAQIGVGFAWWYRAYAKEQSTEDRRRYEQAEKDAQLLKRGIWLAIEPVPPWEWRRTKRL